MSWGREVNEKKWMERWEGNLNRTVSWKSKRKNFKDEIVNRIAKAHQPGSLKVVNMTETDEWVCICNKYRQVLELVSVTFSLSVKVDQAYCTLFGKYRKMAKFNLLEPLTQIPGPAENESPRGVLSPGTFGGTGVLLRLTPARAVSQLGRVVLALGTPERPPCSKAASVCALYPSQAAGVQR